MQRGSSLQPLHLVPSLCFVKKLVKLLKRDRRRQRIPRAYPPLQIKIISDKHREVARISALIDADEHASLSRSRQYAAPRIDRCESDGLDAMGKQHHVDIVEGIFRIQIALERCGGWLLVEHHPKRDGSRADRPVRLHHDK